MKIYFNYMSIPSIKDLPHSERHRIWHACKAFCWSGHIIKCQIAFVLAMTAIFGFLIFTSDNMFLLRIIVLIFVGAVIEEVIRLSFLAYVKKRIVKRMKT